MVASQTLGGTWHVHVDYLQAFMLLSDCEIKLTLTLREARGSLTRLRIRQLNVAVRFEKKCTSVSKLSYMSTNSKFVMKSSTRTFRSLRSPESRTAKIQKMPP